MTLALSHDAHEGRRWSQRFLRSRHLLQALTLRNEEAADAGAAGAVGDEGFTEAIDDPDGEGRSASWEESSKERLRPLIRAHGRAPRETRLVLSWVASVASWCSRVVFREAPHRAGQLPVFPAPQLEIRSRWRQALAADRQAQQCAERAQAVVLLWRAVPYPKKHRTEAMRCLVDG